MTTPKAKAYPKRIQSLLADKTRVLMQAQAFQEMGMAETAKPLWLSAASLEERIAPLLESIGRASDAALHRVSAASCFERAEEFGRAVNLYRAALAGPLPTARGRKREAIIAQALERFFELKLRRWNSLTCHGPTPMMSCLPVIF